VPVNQLRPLANRPLAKNPVRNGVPDGASRVGVASSDAQEASRGSYQTATAEQSQILTIYRVGSGARSRHDSLQGGGLSVSPRAGVVSLAATNKTGHSLFRRYAFMPNVGALATLHCQCRCAAHLIATRDADRYGRLADRKRHGAIPRRWTETAALMGATSMCQAVRNASGRLRAQPDPRLRMGFALILILSSHRIDGVFDSCDAFFHEDRWTAGAHCSLGFGSDMIPRLDRAEK
jgi:hypothetical protein